jgi:hypothetical protein
MTPATGMIISALVSAAGNAAAAAASPQQQQLQSFAGTKVDPQAMLADIMSRLGNAQSNIEGQSFSLPDAYVQTPHGYSGGALPMRIGGDMAIDPRAGVGISTPDVVRRAAGSDGAGTNVWSASQDQMFNRPDNVRVQQVLRRQRANPTTDDSQQAADAVDLLRSVGTGAAGRG